MESNESNESNITNVRSKGVYSGQTFSVNKKIAVTSCIRIWNARRNFRATRAWHRMSGNNETQWEGDLWRGAKAARKVSFWKRWE